jgi:hypothetical protein
LSVNPLRTTACTTSALIVYHLETHVPDGTPISSIDRIGRRFLDDLAAARSDVEAEEILLLLSDRDSPSLCGTVVPGVGGRRIWICFMQNAFRGLQ